MPLWVFYAILSMVFAGITAVLAKVGLQNIHADLGLGIRTSVIFVVIAAVNIITEKYKEIGTLTTAQWWWLIASGLTTTLSWMFYYRAMKDGQVSYVSAMIKEVLSSRWCFRFGC